METNEVISFIKEFKYKGYRVEIYLDDYGQCYCYEIYNKENKLVQDGCCGTYNTDYESEPKWYIDKFTKKNPLN